MKCPAVSKGWALRFRLVSKLTFWRRGFMWVVLLNLGETSHELPSLTFWRQSWKSHSYACPCARRTKPAAGVESSFSGVSGSSASAAAAAMAQRSDGGGREAGFAEGSGADLDAKKDFISEQNSLCYASWLASLNTSSSSTFPERFFRTDSGDGTPAKNYPCQTQTLTSSARPM